MEQTTKRCLDLNRPRQVPPRGGEMTASPSRSPEDRTVLAGLELRHSAAVPRGMHGALDARPQRGEHLDIEEPSAVPRARLPAWEGRRLGTVVKGTAALAHVRVGHRPMLGDRQARGPPTPLDSFRTRKTGRQPGLPNHKRPTPNKYPVELYRASERTTSLVPMIYAHRPRLKLIASSAQNGAGDGFQPRPGTHRHGRACLCLVREVSMSYQAIAAALALEDLSAGERLVAFSLASFANREQRAWPGTPVAAARAGLSRSQYLAAREVCYTGG
jgi:hypothetical protein